MKQHFDRANFLNGAVPADPRFLESVKRCLVLAPHPDDESLGCGGLIAKLLAMDRIVSVVFTTDGSKSHPNSLQYPKERLISIREEEAVVALGILGLSHDQIHFYKGPDSALPGLNEDGFSGFVDKLRGNIDRFEPQLILVPYELDPHRDHRATWQMLIEASKQLLIPAPTIWEYPIWLYENAEQEDIPALKNGELKVIDILMFSELKHKAIFAHRSQTSGMIDDDPTGFRLEDRMIANFTTGNEYFMQRAQLNLGHTLSSTYFDQIYAENPDPWSFETSSYEQAKYQHTVASLPDLTYDSALEIGCSIGVLTAMLAPRCNQLLSVDISAQALEVAKDRLKDRTGVYFKVCTIPQEFPDGNFDLIVMSEVGYYLSLSDLTKARSLIVNHLNDNGVLILVHWTHYVSDYPLTGDEVHECFAESGLDHLHGDRTTDYRLDVYRKKQ